MSCCNAKMSTFLTLDPRDRIFNYQTHFRFRKRNFVFNFVFNFVVKNVCVNISEINILDLQFVPLVFS